MTGECVQHTLTPRVCKHTLGMLEDNHHHMLARGHTINPFANKLARGLMCYPLACMWLGNVHNVVMHSIIDSMGSHY